MKTAELLEQLQKKRTPEEREKDKLKSDYWRLQLRKELSTFNKQFGMTLFKPEKFNPHDHNEARFGGNYNFLYSPDSPVNQEQRARAWQKEMAKKFVALVKQGYKVIIGGSHGEPVEADETVARVHEIVQDHSMMYVQKRPKDWEKQDLPTEICFFFVIRKPDEDQ